MTAQTGQGASPLPAQSTEVSNEDEIQPVGTGMGDDLDCDRRDPERDGFPVGGLDNGAELVTDGGEMADDSVAEVHPVPHPKLRLVNPVPRTKKTKIRASGSTSKKQTDVHPVPHKGKSKDSNRLHPPTIPGHKWKPSGLSGWELYTRKASISATGKRSSTGEYVAYYSQKAVELMNEREKTTNARTA